MNLEQLIEKRIGEIRSESVDFTFGEIINLHKSGEIIIQPEYQRLFRWTTEQQSRLIESILLEFPIPQVFVIENENGIYEVIDGLQRICSLIHFISADQINLEPLVLAGCEIIEELNNKSFEDLTLKLKLRLKRSPIRTIVIKGQGHSTLKYEMFKRLNTGGSLLSHQEIRNCTARMVVPKGVDFYKFINECTQNPDFASCTETLPSSDFEQKGDEELVLRFLAAKNALDMFHGSIKDWLDDYMEKIILGIIKFDFVAEAKSFQTVFSFLQTAMGEGSFVKYKGDKPIGALAPAYFEAISVGTFRNISSLNSSKNISFRNMIVKTVQSEEFRGFTGPGANSKEKLNGRIDLLEAKIREALK